ncbi:MAG: hypothetical protein KAU52_07610 [Methanosarcinales archaeon]|nr:hypothetical protein [Methanosarcinales archaeon]
MKPAKIVTLLALILILCTALMPPASAHRVIVRGAVHEIEIRAYYGGGSADPMAYADVEVYATEDMQEGTEPYITGKTDENGMFYFPHKKYVSEYRIVVEATGHRGEETFNIAEGAESAEDEESEEGLPITGIITGFGYLAGFAGMAMILTARKMKKQYENR